MFDQAYISNITVFAGNFAPLGWLMCQGQILPISEYDVLFNLIGTTYGGDGVETFQLPNFQSRAAIHAGTGAGSTYVIGEMAGTESVTMTVNQMPSHSHPFVSATGNPPASSATGNLNTPAQDVPAVASQQLYNNSGDGLGLAPGIANGQTGLAGGSQPIDILSPYLAMNFIIAIYGIYPTQS